MRPEYPTSILSMFLGHLGQENPKLRDEIFGAIYETFHTDDGRKVLDFLEKAVMLTPCPAGSDERALREKNAQALLVGELRRIAKHGK